MGNKALIPRNSDPYDSGIDSDEGKNSIMNAAFVKDLEEAKIKSQNIFNKNNIVYEKLDEKSKEGELKKSEKFQKSFLSKYSKSASNGGKLNYGEGGKGGDLNRPLLDSFKAQEQVRMTSLNSSDEKWNAYESDGRDSPQLYEVELTASDEDDSSVLELVIPMQTKIKRYHWLLEFLCFGCLYRYE